MKYFIEPTFETKHNIPVVTIAPDSDNIDGHPHVLVIHGLHSTKDYWISYMYSLARAGFVAVGLDLRLHGEWPDASKRVAMMTDNFADAIRSAIYESASDVSRLLDLWKSKPCAWGVVGISLGGCVAHVLAIQEKRFAAICSVLGSPDWLTADPAIVPAPWTPAGMLLKSLSPVNHFEKYAPVALQMLCGEADTTVNPAGSIKLYERLKPVYQKAGIADRLDLQVTPGYDHEFHHDQQDEAAKWLRLWLVK